MHLEIQNKIKSIPNNEKFLKENSYLYKYLNRDRNFIKQFEDQMREKYKLTTSDRIEKFSKGLDNVSKILDILN